MSFHAEVTIGIVRAAFVASVAVLLALSIAPVLESAQGRRRTLVWTLLLAPLLTPALLVSYAYSRVALHLLSQPAALHALYLAALVIKLFPLAAIVLHFVPPALSAEAAHCHAMLARSRWDRRIFAVRGAGRGPWMAGALVFLIAFTDFELPSLWSLKTWPVTLFDAQAGGLAVVESLRLAAVPAVIEFIAIMVCMKGLVVPSASPCPRDVSATGARRIPFLLAVAAFLGSALPLLIVAGAAVSGFRAVAQSFALTRELLVSLAFAAGAVLCAWPLAALARVRSGRAALLVLPGLLGALMLSLLLLALFQTRPLRPLYDSPIPLLLALTLLALPLALPLRWLLDARSRDAALHLARLSHAHGIVWRLDGRRRWLAAMLVFCWAYFDFTAGSILAPVGLTPVFVRLHNLAHYGQTAVLSAMLLAAVAAPAVVLLLTAPLARFYARRDGG